MKNTKVPENIDDYIAGFPKSVKESLVKLRETIRKAAPDAEEKISYQMPMFKQKGVLAYFAVHTNHIGFYPGPSAIHAFKEELTGYSTSTGTVQFPLGKPLPLKLISQMIKYKVKENLEKDESRHKKHQ
jgi:uncharacterized protein YdhG (YjbR/CyaY superfamily)